MTSPHGELPPLYLISDAERVGTDRFVAAATAATAGGLRWVQLREPAWPVERLRELAEALLPALPEDALLTLNWRPGATGTARESLLRQLGLGGMHAGASSPGEIRPLRSRLGDGIIVGYSAHSAEEAAAAMRLGADYVCLAPIFPPLSKLGPVQALGAEALRGACELVRGPLFALGGIAPDNVACVRECGVAGVAVIGAITDAADPVQATRELLAPWS